MMFHCWMMMITLPVIVYVCCMYSCCVLKEFMHWQGRAAPGQTTPWLRATLRRRRRRCRKEHARGQGKISSQSKSLQVVGDYDAYLLSTHQKSTAVDTKRLPQKTRYSHLLVAKACYERPRPASHKRKDCSLSELHSVKLRPKRVQG